jgi:hypothetical protein
MKKLERHELKAIKAGTGGGGGSSCCIFVSATCGNLCFEGDPSACAGTSQFDPNCHYTEGQCPHSGCPTN